MFSYEDRLRAVQLYIKLDKRIGLTIRQLGYPTKNALLIWHREYERRQIKSWAIHLGHYCPIGFGSSIRMNAHTSSVDPGNWRLRPSKLRSSPCACDRQVRR